MLMFNGMLLGASWSFPLRVIRSVEAVSEVSGARNYTGAAAEHLRTPYSQPQLQLAAFHTVQRVYEGERSSRCGALGSRGTTVSRRSTEPPRPTPALLLKRDISYTYWQLPD